MNAFAYLLRSVWFHRRTHAAIFLAAVLASTVVCTALLIGDSVRGTLADLVDRKLQRIQSVALTGDRFFRASLVERAITEHDSAAVLQLEGTALGTDNRRVGHVTVLGVDDAFFDLSEVGTPIALSPFEVALNQGLAERLAATTGDEIVLRVEKPALLPGDAPLSLQSSKGQALRLTVVAVLEPEQLADFSLRNATEWPVNAFVNRQWLAEQVELSGMANLLLSATPASRAVDTSRRLTGALEPEDVGLILKQVGKQVELQSKGIFLPASVTTALEREGKPIFTYFVNACRFKDRASPYFFVCGADFLLPTDLPANEVAINQWLADDLGVAKGGEVAVDYFLMDPRGGLRETTTMLKIGAILPTVDRRHLMPAFPGMADADSCSDWDAGLPVDLDKIRDTDETYWDDYKGTPRIHLPLATARTLWGNRFGNLTAIRFDATEAEVRTMVKRVLTAEAFGLAVAPVRDQHLVASRSGVDFGGLFIGLSVFIIVAALTLIGLMFAFSVARRAEESAILSATGFIRGRIVRHYVLEGAILVIPAATVGAAFAVGLNRVVLERISTVWKGAVNAMRIAETVHIQSLALGIGITVAMAVLTLVAASYRSVSGTVQQTFQREVIVPKGRLPWVLVVLFGGAAIVLAATSSPSSGKDAAGVFMGAGFCALIGLVALYALILRGLRRFLPEEQSTILLVARSLCANAGRHLAILGILASAIFIVFGVSANRFDPNKDAGTVISGTGGYDFFAQVSVPVLERLDTAEGRKAFGLDAPNANDISFHGMKVAAGADASCLNLNKVVQPGVLGIDARALHDRGAFSFAKVLDNHESPWTMLEKPFDDGAIPVIADMNVILWSLGKGIGDTMTLTDDAGTPYVVRFVGGLKSSLFQGWILMDVRQFTRIYPSVSGTGAMLIDCPDGRIDEASAILRETFMDSGIELEPALSRLARFNRVESTYLEIFQALGGLGLLIGTVGLALVVSRNVLERRAELAVMRAVGYSKGRLTALLFWEHAVVFADGLLVGVLAGLIAMAPAMESQAGEVPWAALTVQITAIAVAGLAWIWCGCKLALKGPLVPALRSE